MLNTLNSLSRWNRLRLFGNSAVAQSTIAVPLLGYLILFNTNVIDYLKLHSAFCQGSSCGVSWRLYFIYFGCSAIALGAGIYGVFCPPLIKKYAGASDFFEAEKTYFSQPSNLRYLFDQIETEKQKPASDPHNLKEHFLAKDGMLHGNYINALAGVMGEHYVLQIYTHSYARICSLIAYAVGTLLLLIPAVYTFIQVLWRALQAISVQFS